MSSFGLTSASMMLYIVVLSAIASASDTTATVVNPGCLTSVRTARRTSWPESRISAVVFVVDRRHEIARVRRRGRGDEQLEAAGHRTRRAAAEKPRLIPANEHRYSRFFERSACGVRLEAG